MHSAGPAYSTTEVTVSPLQHKVSSHKKLYNLHGEHKKVTSYDTEHINKAVVNVTRHLTAYIVVAANGGHFEHLQYSIHLQIYILISLPTDYKWRLCLERWEVESCLGWTSIILLFSNIFQ